MGKAHALNWSRPATLVVDPRPSARFVGLEVVAEKHRPLLQMVLWMVWRKAQKWHVNSGRSLTGKHAYAPRGGEQAAAARNDCC